MTCPSIVRSGAQVVRDAVSEGFQVAIRSRQLAIRDFELRRAFGDALLARLRSSSRIPAACRRDCVMSRSDAAKRGPAGPTNCTIDSSTKTSLPSRQRAGISRRLPNSDARYAPRTTPARPSGVAAGPAE